MATAERSKPGSVATEQRYRSRWSWDSVSWGTHCVDCYPGNCPYRVYVRDGRVVREESAGSFRTVEEGVPDFNPMGCNKGACWSQQLYDGDRFLHPLRRVGERGSGKWERISWDEACTEVADAMLDVIEAGAPEDIAKEGTPEVATVLPTSRFFGIFGGRQLDLHASFNDFSIGLHETFGKFCPVSSGDDWFKSELVLVWHMNPAFTRIPLYHFINEARYHGAEVVSISPDLNASHMHADVHVPITSGDDVPFALAMVQVILEEGIADWTFVREQTDLPMLVRTDDGRYLRQTDVDGRGDGRAGGPALPLGPGRGPGAGGQGHDEAGWSRGRPGGQLRGPAARRTRGRGRARDGTAAADSRRRVHARDAAGAHRGPSRGGSLDRPEGSGPQDQHHAGVELLQVLPRGPHRAVHVPAAWQ